LLSGRLKGLKSFNDGNFYNNKISNVQVQKRLDIADFHLLMDWYKIIIYLLKLIRLTQQLPHYQLMKLVKTKAFYSKWISLYHQLKIYAQSVDNKNL